MYKGESWLLTSLVSFEFKNSVIKEINFILQILKPIIYVIIWVQKNQIKCLKLPFKKILT